MTSHSKTLLSMRPQLMPGMSLSLCISLSWRLRSPEAAELAILLCSKPNVDYVEGLTPDLKRFVEEHARGQGKPRADSMPKSEISRLTYANPMQEALS